MLSELLVHLMKVLSGSWSWGMSTFIYLTFSVKLQLISWFFLNFSVLQLTISHPSTRVWFITVFLSSQAFYLVSIKSGS